MNPIQARTADLSVAKLQEMASLLISDMREGADMVLSAVLDALMAKMPEAEFVAFCDGLDA